jgi:hypothetical protein
MSHSNTLPVRPLDPTPTPRIAGLVAWAHDAASGVFGGISRAVFGGASEPSPRIAEASVVRQMADRLICSDPSLAADLYAAASRHERIDEDLARR